MSIRGLNGAVAWYRELIVAEFSVAQAQSTPEAECAERFVEDRVSVTSTRRNEKLTLSATLKRDQPPDSKMGDIN